MMRNYFKYVGVAFSLALLAPLAVPTAAVAQEDCVEGGDAHTRGAELELTWASRKDDPQTKPERYNRALEKLAESYADPPVEPRTHLLAARSYLGLRDYVGADSSLSMLVESAPQCSDQALEMRFNAWVPLYNSGIEKLAAGDEDGALAAFEQANQIYTDSRSMNNIASIYQSRGETSRAIEMYQEALESGGEEEMVRVASINLAELMRAEGRDAEALQIYSDYSANHPEDILGRLNYAIALLDAGSDDEAQAIFTSLLVRDDLNFLQWSQVGIGLYRAQNFDEAALAFHKAHELQPLNKETLENLANSYYQAERFDELEPLADTLVMRYPYEKVNYNLLANARTETGDEDGALETLEAREGMTFEFLRAQLGPVADGTYSIDGTVMNTSGTGGSEVTIPVHFLSEGGQVAVTEPLTLTLPAAGEASGFQIQVQSDTPILGFRYDKAGS
ncbi:MAG: tetratricopeptide repeat protein [marine benthic group bacterium]|nr:tetratricopeptide repeat protein [Gemmatimonadota bacterium]